MKIAMLFFHGESYDGEYLMVVNGDGKFGRNIWINEQCSKMPCWIGDFTRLVIGHWKDQPIMAI